LSRRQLAEGQSGSARSRALDPPDEVALIRSTAATGLDVTTLWHQFDTLDKDLHQQELQQTHVAAGVTLGTLALSTLYVLWTLKGGYFLAALPILDFDEAAQKRRDRGRASRRMNDLDWVRD
jgi:hypothetical protein